MYRGNDPGYPEKAPFHPRERYPEYAWKETGTERNLAYEAVRGCFLSAGLDEEQRAQPIGIHCVT